MARLTLRGAALFALLAFPVATSQAADVTGQSTVDVRILGNDRSGGFSFLRTGPGEPHVTREGLGAAVAGRETRRRSLAYFAQLTDFQLADEEGPARVEELDPAGGPVSSAWRPHEALGPHMIDRAIRQVNAHSTSGVADGSGAKAQLGFAIMTGDNADNQQRNETEWVVRLLQGGTLNPNSGSSDPADYAACPPGTPGPEEGARYTGYQDYDDYYESGEYYDPDKPAGRYATWPTWPGLMDEAQRPFEVAGLDVPSYVAFGNHDALAQGNEDSIAAFEAVGTGCAKVMYAPDSFPTVALADWFATDPSKTVLVPPDPNRQYVDKAQYKEIFKGSENGHGFNQIDPAELQASGGSAGYYSFKPAPRMRFIAIDTVSEGGTVYDSSEGNIDDPQFRWIEAQLKEATAADELVVLFGHHSIQSLISMTPDEAAAPCLGNDSHGHDVNPGCDRDPRNSQPIHDGNDLTALLHAYPHAIAFVAGHSHVNDVVPFPKTGGGAGFWNIRTSAEADWPHQQRLLEVMDNRDGTLSIFGTLIDNAGEVVAPPSGTAAAGLSAEALAAIGRTIGYNDPQLGGGTGEGEGIEDRNVELVIADPRRDPGAALRTVRRGTRLKVSVRPRRVVAGRRTRVRVRVSVGTRAVRGATVRIGSRRVATTRRGTASFVLRPRRAGTLRVKVSVRGGATATATLRVARRR